MSRLLFISLTLFASAGCPRASNPPQADKSHDNSKLIATTVQRLLDHHGDDIDAASLPEAHGVVLMVYHAHVVLMDGGFCELFTSEFPGDPDYQLTLQAFETIGALQACDAFRKAFSVLPDATLPRDFGERIRAMRTLHLTDGGVDEGPGANEIYAAAAAETLAGLQAYIAAPPAEFSMLE